MPHMYTSWRPLQQPAVDVGTGFSRVLHQLWQRPLLCSSEDAAKTLIQAFIDTRLVYCNSLYYG